MRRYDLLPVAMAFSQFSRFSLLQSVMSSEDEADDWEPAANDDDPSYAPDPEPEVGQARRRQGDLK